MKTLYALGIVLIIFNHCNAQTDTADTIYSFVEQEPQFPGGDKALMSFISQNIKYPEYERTNNIQGKVVLRFVVNNDGSIGNIEIIKAVSLGLNSEAVRIVKLLPNFTPGKQEGKVVKVYFSLPITFKLTERPLPKVNPDSDNVYRLVEEQPNFPGGDAALMKFLTQIIRYPADARRYNVTGKVLIRFVVNEDGSVSDIHVIKSLYPSLDAEAARVVRLLPKFVPGKEKGKPVKVYFNLPIVFRLN